MRHILPLALCIAFVGVAQPLWAAQPELSARSRALTRQVVTEFGNCAADRQPDTAAAYVRSDFDGRLEEGDWRDLVDRRCLRLRGGQLRMDVLSFRGAVAERLIATQLGGEALSELEAVPPLARREPQASDLAALSPKEQDDRRSEFARSLERIYVVRLGECVVRRDPAGARHLFETEAGSDQERAAIAAMSTSIAACVPAGEQLRVDRSTLRAGTAISYYRLAAASGRG